MRKKQDIIWERSTLWESVEGWVIRYLKKNHPEYRDMQTQAIKLVENNPALWKLMSESRGVTLTQEDHKGTNILKSNAVYQHSSMNITFLPDR